MADSQESPKLSIDKDSNGTIKIDKYGHIKLIMVEAVILNQKERKESGTGKGHAQETSENEKFCTVHKSQAAANINIESKYKR